MSDNDQLVIAVAITRDAEIGEYAITYGMSGEVIPVLPEDRDRERYSLLRIAVAAATHYFPGDETRWPIDPLCEFSYDAGSPTRVSVFQLDIVEDLRAHPSWKDKWSPRGRNGLTAFRETLEEHLKTHPDLKMTWIRGGALRYPN